MIYENDMTCMRPEHDRLPVTCFFYFICAVVLYDVKQISL